ncbi:MULTISPECIES: hypothetical protein [Corynebacterium]|uniref:Anticodon nuclease n=1 Tax=Corynebacterium flavescens TaxID=28028 RepID=A0AB73B6Q9_CORFL|nr:MULTISPECIES: hypothetical protein [Corynebacterium]KAA8719525.1 anticodon nuclease [Corynebacterium flavescens]MDN6200408.1 hypothetical protein [Corynebacterium flavescens]GEB97510.1 anticodon nuclease [Corynebacterium flavescens]
MHYESLQDLAYKLRRAKANNTLIFAPNTIGKTRLSQSLKEQNPEGVMLYNALVEDDFIWDNERVVFKMNLDSELLSVIVTQGLDGEIIKNFQRFTNERIEPTLDFASGEITFGVYRGDDNPIDGIKLSRAEESIFVWCVYFTVLSEAVDVLLEDEELCSTAEYDALAMVVIDDPVSSMDDMRIITVALALSDLMERAAQLDLKFLVTTHHALFFNVLFNSLKSKQLSKRACLLQRGVETGWELEEQPKDSPFSYHLSIIGDLERAISENKIQRIHFNQFRTLLEKTANFLGYSGWTQLLTGMNAPILKSILNLYSHDRIADTDSFEVYDIHKEALKTEFSEFLKNFRWAAVE